MNNFLERSNTGLGGPKPRGWTNTSSVTSRRGPSGAPAALPSGGGLPVFEKRVQLKEPLPMAARGNPLKNPMPPYSPDPVSPPRQTLKAPTTLPSNPVRPHIPHHGPGWRPGDGESMPPTPSERVRPMAAVQATGASSRSSGGAPNGEEAAVNAIMAAGGLGSPSLAPMGGGASTRTMSAPPTSQRTSSPSGRMHPNPVRRAELRKADMFQNIDYYGGYGAPDNDRLVKEASFLSTQSWFESLRYYPKGEDADDDEACYSGLTHGMAAPTEHLETDVRTRLGIAKADTDWVPDQLQMQWLPESPSLLKRLKKSYLNLRR